MASIRLLSEETINQIAAGEVIQRPAHAVKELMENAIDAGSTEIIVKIENGGKTLIQIQDNGKGIPAQQLPLALKRHATSKISAFEDLIKVKSKGFRGEALASMAAIGNFSLSSVAEGGDEGLTIEVSGGENPTQKPYYGKQGTIASLRHIFSEVPARREFLKSDASEFLAIQEMFVSLALSHTDLSFQLWHNGKKKYHVAGQSANQKASEKISQRVEDLFGKEMAESLIPFSGRNAYGEVGGLVSHPRSARASAKFQYFFVNQRWVKDRKLKFALHKAFHSHLLPGKHPACFCFIESEPALIDVNIHPSKTEVKFQYESEMQSLLASSIRQAIREGAWGSPSGQGSREETEITSYSKPVFQSSSKPISSHSHSMETKTTTGGSGTGIWKGAAPVPARRTPPIISNPGSVTAKPQISNNLTESPDKEHADQSFDLLACLREARYIGTFAKCYLFFEFQDKLLTLDQHAFHERILYEKMVQDKQYFKVSEALAIPDVVDLDDELTMKLKENTAKLKNLGIELAFPGDEQVEVNKLPSLLKKANLESLLCQLGETLQGESAEQTIHHDILSTMACHAAVRSGEELPFEDIQSLIRSAESIDFFHNCPHGRPVFKWFSLRDVSKWFER